MIRTLTSHHDHRGQDGEEKLDTDGNAAPVASEVGVVGLVGDHALNPGVQDPSKEGHQGPTKVDHRNCTVLWEPISGT